MISFTFHSPRVVFGTGSLSHLEREIELLGARRALVLSTPQRRGADDIAHRLAGRYAGTFDGAVMHVPIEVARAAREEARRLDADCAVAVGGGSTIGLAKAIALESGLRILAIPTTYSGSEMTPVFGITEAGQKRTGRDVRVLPRTVIYDPAVTAALPPRIAGLSGMNAIAHACEGLYAENLAPGHALLAEEGIRTLARGLPGDAERSLYGAWLCGVVLAGAAMGLHHKLCHTLGGTFNLPHAETHAAVLPHALAYNQSAAPEAMRRIAGALDAEEAPSGVYDLAKRLGASMALRDLGMPESGLDRAAEISTTQPYPNARPLERRAVRQLLQDAWEGRRPGGSV
jgi:maleylacetate reductase